MRPQFGSIDTLSHNFGTFAIAAGIDSIVKETIGSTIPVGNLIHSSRLRIIHFIPIIIESILHHCSIMTSLQSTRMMRNGIQVVRIWIRSSTTSTSTLGGDIPIAKRILNTRINLVSSGRESLQVNN